MTNGISGYNPNNTVYNGLKAVAASHSNDVGNLVKFLQGEAVTNNQTNLGQTVLWTVPAMSIFGGIKGTSWLWQNRGDLKGATANLRTEALAVNGKNIPKNFTKEIKEYGNRIFKGLTPAEKAAIQAQPRSWFGKMLDWIPGYKKLRPTGFGQAMGRSGAGFMIATEGLMNTFTEVIPAFQQCGVKSGLKQVAKSGTKVAANAAGWLAGEAVGSAAGVAIGTAICPGIGTAIGKFIGGFLGGAIACHFAGKAATKLTGKSEIELKNEKQLAEQTAQIENDPTIKKQLAEQSIAYANEILKVDPQNKEALAALENANNILKETQQPSTDLVAETGVAPQQQNTQQTVTQPLDFVPVVPGFNGVSYNMDQYNQMRQNATMFSIPSQMIAQNQNTQPVGQNIFSQTPPIQPTTT